MPECHCASHDVRGEPSTPWVVDGRGVSLPLRLQLRHLGTRSSRKRNFSGDHRAIFIGARLHQNVAMVERDRTPRVEFRWIFQESVARFDLDQRRGKCARHYNIMRTVEHLRRLIAQYRERLEEGTSVSLTIFILNAIREAERELAAIETTPPPTTH